MQSSIVGLFIVWVLLTKIISSVHLMMNGKEQFRYVNFGSHFMHNQVNFRSSYPISNHCFGEIWRIEVLLTSNLTNEDLLIQNMCCRMKENFDKYWSEYSVILAFGVIFYPTKKLNFFLWIWGKVGKIKNALYALFEEYNKKVISTSMTLIFFF